MIFLRSKPTNCTGKGNQFSFSVWFSPYLLVRPNNRPLQVQEVCTLCWFHPHTQGFYHYQFPPILLTLPGMSTCPTHISINNTFQGLTHYWLCKEGSQASACIRITWTACWQDPASRVSDSTGLECSWEHGFLTCSQQMMTLMVQGTHLENLGHNALPDTAAPSGMLPHSLVPTEGLILSVDTVWCLDS